MAKGFFSQGVSVLFSRKITVKDLKNALKDFTILKENRKSEIEDFGGAGVLIDFDRKINGLAVVDIVEKKWPDHMGDPKKEMNLFGAWTMGHYGPHAFPGNLERAVQHSWGWKEAKEKTDKHVCIARIRLSYIFGADKDAKVLPGNYDPFRELDFICRAADALLCIKSAVCYFNPNGERLIPAGKLTELLDRRAEEKLPALDVWTNIRIFNVADGWYMMDCVGSMQFEVKDQEVCFPKEYFNPMEVDGFIRNTVLYLIEKGEVIKDGDTIDGPGGKKLKAYHRKDGLASPPRDVIRWVPEGLSDVPEVFLKTDDE